MLSTTACDEYEVLFTLPFFSRKNFDGLELEIKVSDEKIVITPLCAAPPFFCLTIYLDAKDGDTKPHSCVLSGDGEFKQKRLRYQFRGVAEPLADQSHGYYCTCDTVDFVQTHDKHSRIMSWKHYVSEFVFCFRLVSEES
jgi:hypothetical protein